MDTTAPHALVPALVGLEVAEAHVLALEARVVAVSGDPDTPSPVAGTVVAQHPGPGTQVEPGAPVVLEVADEGGGGGGGGSARPPDGPSPGNPSGAKVLPDRPVAPA